MQSSQVNEAPRLAFKNGDMAVHPAHGVGEVVEIEQRELGGRPATCFVLKIIDTGLKVMVPTDAAERVGLRAVMKKREADKIIDILKAPEVAVDVQPWNRRFRAYTEMLKSGLPSASSRNCLGRLSCWHPPQAHLSTGWSCLSTVLTLQH